MYASLSLSFCFAVLCYNIFSRMKFIITFLLVMLLVVEAITAQNSCDGINNQTRSQICLSGQCPLDCDKSNSSEYSTCDQVCVVNPCASLSCSSSICLQRCLTGGCNSLVCSSDDCTQTCLRNCTAINSTVTTRGNQQCEKGYCGLHAIGDARGVVEQTCAENCNDVKCKADKCRQACAGEGCGLECLKGTCNIQRLEFIAFFH